MEAVRTFYESLLGFQEIAKSESSVSLSSSLNESPRIILTEDLHALPRSPRSPGLFHVAILFPNRQELARVFRRLYEQEYPFQGFADHGVSEALYLADPEGNGIELYADRPRDAWPMKNGELQMVTEALDVDDLMKQADDSLGQIHRATKIGHIHLQVSDLQKAERFYVELLGFDVVQRSYPGALFVSAGGYHHHIGLNTWNSRSMPPASAGVAGLMGFGVRIPEASLISSLVKRLEEKSIVVEKEGVMFRVKDFDGIQIEVVS